MSTLTEITSKDDLSSHLASLAPSALLVLYFYTPWTAFSTQMSVDLSRLASQYPVTTPPAISFVGIDGKKLLDIAKEYGVRKAPCVIYIRNGETLEPTTGSDFTAIRNAFNRHFGSIDLGIPITPAPEPGQLTEALLARLTDLVKTSPVMLFMKGTPNSPRCRFSRRLVDLLREHGIEFDSFNVLTDEDVRQGLKEFADWPTFPQLWVHGQLVGGLEIVREELKSDPSTFMDRHLVNNAVVTTTVNST